MRTLTLLLASVISCAAADRFDVVVYGGTAGGVIAAVSSAREGLKTALIEPTKHIGGMVSGGLGFTDFGKKEVIGGYSLEFYFRVGRYYGMSQYGNEVSWYHEPHVAEQIFRQMLREANVTVVEGKRLKEKGGVRKTGLKLTEIEMEDGASYAADIFIDSSYEGDVMAQSGVSYTWGREGTAQYGETLAGVRDKTPFHQFLVDVNPRDANGNLLPEVSANKPPAPGSADKLVQAYNYRMCFSNVAGKQVAFPKPAGYDPKRYEILLRWIEARTAKEGKAPGINTVLKVDVLPNGTSDVNNNGAVSTDYIGGSWEYPDATYAKRAEIWKAHKDYIAGLLYTLANNDRIPKALHDEVNKWGLCKEEFVDNDYWPYQLYIREARRMVGEYVAIQKDLQTELTKPDPIGMGSYNSDSHNIERIVDEQGLARNEGDMQVGVKPYQIPYRVLTPKKSEAVNLLVPVCFSASHVAYSSMRMEPQYMIMGQAAGVAARLAIKGKTAVQDIDTKALITVLKRNGATMEYVPSAQTAAVNAIRKFVK